MSQGRPNERLYVGDEEAQLRRLRPNSDQARSIRERAHRRYLDSRTETEVAAERLTTRSRGNAPLTLVNNARERASSDEAFSAAVRRVAGINDRDFNIFDIGRKGNVPFANLTNRQQIDSYQSILGRAPTSQEIQGQVQGGGSLFSFMIGAKEELRSRGLDRQASSIEQFQRYRKGSSNFRKFTTAATMVGSMVTGGWTAAALQAGNRVGWAAYDELQGVDVAWEDVAADVGSSIAAYSGNPFVTGGTAAAVTYIRTGDAGDAAVSGALTGYATGRSGGAQIAAQAANDYIVNGDDLRAILMSAGFETAIQRSANPNTRMSIRAAREFERGGLNQFSMLQIMTQGHLERKQAGDDGLLELPSEEDFWDLESRRDPGDLFSFNTNRNREGEVVPASRLFTGRRRRAGLSLTDGDASTQGMMAALAPRASVSRAPVPAASAGGSGLTRGGFEVY